MSQTLQTLALEYAAALLDWHELSLHCNRSEKVHGTVLREDENAARKARDAMYDAQQALDNAALAEAARKSAVKVIK